MCFIHRLKHFRLIPVLQQLTLRGLNEEGILSVCSLYFIKPSVASDYDCWVRFALVYLTTPS
ncbi:hypothetical protein BHM03_00025085 [Ensete ventricosum]|nr:hypothetical protein BHM03_00025085 [Ensete ventricosum]